MKKRRRGRNLSLIHILIAQEAGAHVTTFAGTPVDPMQPGSMFCTNQVCADLLGRITV